MPTVLRVGGFRVVIFLPPREHGPPHVHVQNANGEVVIELANAGVPQHVRRVRGLRFSEFTEACRIVEYESDFLLECWRRHHG